MTTPEAQVAKEKADQDQRKAMRDEMRKQQNLRRAALALADDQHGQDAAILKLKKKVDAAANKVQALKADIQALQMDEKMAALQLEKALEKHINAKYKRTKDEWEQLEARFKRNA